MLTVFISPVPKLISSTSTVTVFVYLAVSYNESTLQDYGVDNAASDNRITNADNPVLPMDNVTVINIASEENASVIDVFAAGNNTLKTLAYLRPILWSPSKIAVLIVTLSIMFETVIGNCLVVLSVLMEKKLQTPFNYYILNLALTDLNVGLSAMPLFTIMNLYGYFPFDSYACS